VYQVKRRVQLLHHLTTSTIISHRDGHAPIADPVGGSIGGRTSQASLHIVGAVSARGRTWSYRHLRSVCAGGGLPHGRRFRCRAHFHAVGSVAQPRAEGRGPSSGLSKQSQDTTSDGSNVPCPTFVLSGVSWHAMPHPLVVCTHGIGLLLRPLLVQHQRKADRTRYFNKTPIPPRAPHAC